MKIKYNKATRMHLQNLFTESDYSVRYERGQFKSGYCLLHDKKIIVVNKFFDEKGKIDSLLDILSQINLKENLLSERSIEFLKVVERDYLSKNLVA